MERSTIIGEQEATPKPQYQLLWLAWSGKSKPLSAISRASRRTPLRTPSRIVPARRGPGEEAVQTVPIGAPAVGRGDRVEH